MGPVESGDWLDQVAGINVWKKGDQRAPHKPLLILLALATWRRTGSSRLVFQEAERELAPLLQSFGPPSTKPQPQYPFVPTRPPTPHMPAHASASPVNSTDQDCQRRCWLQPARTRPRLQRTARSGEAVVRVMTRSTADRGARPSGPCAPPPLSLLRCDPTGRTPGRNEYQRGENHGPPAGSSDLMATPG